MQPLGVFSEFCPRVFEEGLTVFSAESQEDEEDEGEVEDAADEGADLPAGAGRQAGPLVLKPSAGGRDEGAEEEGVTEEGEDCSGREEGGLAGGEAGGLAEFEFEELSPGVKVVPQAITECFGRFAERGSAGFSGVRVAVGTGAGGGRRAGHERREWERGGGKTRIAARSAAHDEANEEAGADGGEESLGGMLADVFLEIGVGFPGLDAGAGPLVVGGLAELVGFFTGHFPEVGGFVAGVLAELLSLFGGGFLELAGAFFGVVGDFVGTVFGGLAEVVCGLLDGRGFVAGLLGVGGMFAHGLVVVG